MAKLEFSLDKIMSVTEARNNFNKIVEGIEKDPEGKFLLTKGGKPSVAMVNSNFLEKLMGEKSVTVEEKEQKIEPQPETKPSQETPPLKIAQETPAPPAVPTPPISPTQPTSPTPTVSPKPVSPTPPEIPNPSQPPADQDKV